jgi:hypothetical protein
VSGIPPNDFVVAALGLLVQRAVRDCHFWNVHVPVSTNLVRDEDPSVDECLSPLVQGGGGSGIDVEHGDPAERFHVVVEIAVWVSPLQACGQVVTQNSTEADETKLRVQLRLDETSTPREEDHFTYPRSST